MLLLYKTVELSLGAVFRGNYEKLNTKKKKKKTGRTNNFSLADGILFHTEKFHASTVSDQSISGGLFI